MRTRLLGGLAVLLLTTAIGQADSFSRNYSGSLTSTSDVLRETFSLGTVSQLTADTTSYARGGFQPSLTLYTGAGMYVASQQAGSPVATKDAATGLALDSYLKARVLSAGSYILTLTNWQTQQPPTATNLSDGFVNYGGAVFSDVSGATRTASYALDVTVAPAASGIPEPGTLAATGVGFGLMVAGTLRRRAKRRISERRSG